MYGAPNIQQHFTPGVDLKQRRPVYVKIVLNWDCAYVEHDLRLITMTTKSLLAIRHVNSVASNSTPGQQVAR